MKQNRVILTAALESKEPLRYSPAGVPVLNFRLTHESEQIEAGRPRIVTCEMPAVAIGEVATRIAQLETRQERQFSGFLVTRRRYDTAELHVVEFTET